LRAKTRVQESWRVAQQNELNATELRGIQQAPWHLTFCSTASTSICSIRNVVSAWESRSSLHVGFGRDAWKGLVEAEASLWARYHCYRYCLAACDTVGLLSSDIRLYVYMFARVCVFDIFVGVALLWLLLYFGLWHWWANVV